MVSLTDWNPETVERKEGMTWNLSEHGGRECVLAWDYDRLLDLYHARYLENIRLLNDASIWRNRTIDAETELSGANRLRKGTK